MRTRSRLLLSFVGVHLVLSVVMGWAAWRWVDESMREQAEGSARSVGRVLAQGKFPLTPEVIAKMRELTGFEFRILPRPTAPRQGTVQLVEEGEVVEVEYQTVAYQRARDAVLVGTLALILAGSAGFGLVAFWLSAQFAGPVERLAGAARAIGSGDLDAAVPAIGSGEIAELAREFEQMRGRLHQLDRQNRQAERLAAIGTFTATIAHEVRNPLTAVQLTVQLLAKRLPGDASLGLIMEELERLDLIIDELLGYSKGMTADLQPCALRVVAEDVARLMRRQAEHAGVAIVIQGVAQVRADAARLRQLLMNLVLNAIQAQHGGGRVVIDLRPDGLAVCDDGPGVAPDLAERMFEPFSTGRPAGTGLGLHLARAVADAHGARLGYDPAQAARLGMKGACFVLAGLTSAEAGSTPQRT